MLALLRCLSGSHARSFTLTPFANVLSNPRLSTQANLKSQLALTRPAMKWNRFSTVISPTISTSDAINILQKLFTGDLGHLPRSILVDQICSIHNQFPRSSPKVDFANDNMFLLYIQLAKAYFNVGDSESAREIVSILQSSCSNAICPTALLWRQLQIDHCQCIDLAQNGSFAEAGSKLEALVSSAENLLKASDHNLAFDLFCDLVKQASALHIMSHQYDRACDILKSALQLITEVRGNNSIEAISIKHHLAIAFANNNSIDQLVHLCECLLTSKLPKDFEIASILSNISELLLTRNHPNLSLCLKLSTLSVKILNELSIKSESAARIYGTHGVILNALKEFAEAEHILQKAITLLPSDHFHLHLLYHNLGSAYIGLKRFHDAVKYLELAIERYKEGQEESMATCFGHLGEAYEMLGRHDDAEAAISKAVALKRTTMPGSTQLVVDLQNLAAMKQRKLLKDEAVDLYREALANIIQHFGESHLQAACARRLLVNALIGARRFEEAVKECELCLPVLEKDGSLVQYQNLIVQYCQLLVMMGCHEEARNLNLKVKKWCQIREIMQKSEAEVK